MTKTLIVYGRDSKSARDFQSEKFPVSANTSQIIQADAYQGERLEADELHFMGDVPADQQARIRNLFGKFDNRVVNEKGMGPARQPNDPAADRRNLNEATRVDDPKKVEPKELDHPATVAEPRGKRPEPGQNKPTGMNAVTGEVSRKAREE